MRLYSKSIELISGTILVVFVSAYPVAPILRLNVTFHKKLGTVRVSIKKADEDRTCRNNQI